MTESNDATPTPSKKDVEGTPESVLGTPTTPTRPDPSEIIAAARAREAAALSRSVPGASGDSLPPLPAENPRRATFIALGVVALAVVIVVVIVLVVVL